MNNLIKDVRQAIEFHSKRAIKSHDILFGDELLLKLIIDNYQKEYDYQVLHDEVIGIINIELLELSDVVANDYDTSKYDLVSNGINSKVDKAIFDILSNIENDFVRNELIRMALAPKKMLRAKMFLKMQEENNYEYAALIELFHLATLLQDDVIDKASMRRHEQTLNDLYNDTTAILISDYLLVHIGEMLRQFQRKDTNGNKVNKKVSNYYQELVKLFLKRLLFSETQALKLKTTKDYDTYAIDKTARFFELSIVSGLINAKPAVKINELEEAALFGQKFGLLFQKVDDLIDYMNDSASFGKDSRDSQNGINNYILMNVSQYDIKQIKQFLLDDVNQLEMQREYAKMFEQEIEYLKWRIHG